MKKNYPSRIIACSILAIAPFAARAFPAVELLDSQPNRNIATVINEAIDDTLAPRESSYFNEILDWYDNGKEVSFEDVKGGWSGRCFAKVDPNAPLNDILVSFDDNPAGPAFPSNKYLGLMCYPSKAPNFYDDYDIEKDDNAVVQILRETIAKKQIQQITSDNGTLTWTLDLEPNQRRDIKYFVRRYKDFIVVRGDNLIENNSLYSQTLQRTISGVKKGPWTACYYFKNLSHPN